MFLDGNFKFFCYLKDDFSNIMIPPFLLKGFKHKFIVCKDFIHTHNFICSFQAFLAFLVPSHLLWPFVCFSLCLRALVSVFLTSLPPAMEAKLLETAKRGTPAHIIFKSSRPTLHFASQTPLEFLRSHSGGNGLRPLQVSSSSSSSSSPVRYKIKAFFCYIFIQFFLLVYVIL